MDKLENYLDQVCRSIGGSRSLRQHVRQELREHLRDAVAQHRAAGSSEEEALERALDEFGKPEEVRSELEATHGYRLMAVVIDKAMQWKETTMKAKWLWTTWAYLTLVGVIALEVFWITFAAFMITPKLRKIRSEGWIDHGQGSEYSWMYSFLDQLDRLVEDQWVWCFMLSLVIWGLFEWGVRGDNKPMMRICALGSAALGLMVVVILSAASLVVLLTFGWSGAASMAKQEQLVNQLSVVASSVEELEQAMKEQDWESIAVHANEATKAMNVVEQHGASHASRIDPTKDWRATLKAAGDRLKEVQQAIQDQDAVKLETTLRKFRASYGPVQDLSKKKTAAR